MITIHNSIIPPSRHIPAPWIVLASILSDMSGQLAEQAHCSKCAAFAFCLMLTVHITQPFRGLNDAYLQLQGCLCCSADCQEMTTAVLLCRRAPLQ